jgi:hypothetical protein
MFTIPRIGVFVAIGSCLAITLAILVLPADLFWACAAPERYLAGAREFVGPTNVSDDLTQQLRTPPSAVLAWRRLAAARDTAAFARLLAARSPAARLYGLAGLRLLAPPLAERGVKRFGESPDTVIVNWRVSNGVCRCLRLSANLICRGGLTPSCPRVAGAGDACGLTSRCSRRTHHASSLLRVYRRAFAVERQGR